MLAGEKTEKSRSPLPDTCQPQQPIPASRDSGLTAASSAFWPPAVQTPASAHETVVAELVAAVIAGALILRHHNTIHHNTKEIST
jgi:hypothetical protein